MTAYTDELLERKWRELGNVPIDYTPDEPDGVFGDGLVHLRAGRTASRRCLALVRFPLHRRYRCLDVRNRRVD